MARGLFAKLIAATLHTAHSTVDNIFEGARDIVSDGLSIESGEVTPIAGALNIVDEVLETSNNITDDIFGLVAFKFDAVSTAVSDFADQVENHFEAKLDFFADVGHKVGHVADNLLEIVGIDIGFDCCQSQCQ
ncbi:MAG: hypothetical protein LBU76_10165 [Azoarcus sp.]|jgi:uncharacterized protein YoxC|nr:hypothetical protein [Azoarcus sp.]